MAKSAIQTVKGFLIKEICENEFPPQVIPSFKNIPNCE